MRWGWVFIGEAVLFAVVLGVLGLGLLRRVAALRREVARLQRALPDSRVPGELERLSAARPGPA